MLPRAGRGGPGSEREATLPTLPEQAAGATRREMAGSDGGLTVQRLSTEAIPLRDRYAFWKEAVCDLFVSCDCTRNDDAPFHGAAVRRAMAGTPKEATSIIEVESVAQQASHSQRHIRRAADAWIMLVMQTAGPAVLRQEGRTAALGEGDMVLFDSTRPYDFRFERPFRQLVMKIPHHRLATRLPPPSLWLGRALRASSPLGKVLAAHVTVMSNEIGGVDPAVRPGLVDRTIDLVAFTFAGLQSDLGDAASTARRVLLLRATQYIDAHVENPNLAPSHVAAALGISVGYLHRLFQSAETSISGYMREYRLARCREALGSPLHAGEHVTEIALRWGFNDLPHFSRAFRAQYGMSPRDYRAAALDRNTGRDQNGNEGESP